MRDWIGMTLLAAGLFVGFYLGRPQLDEAASPAELRVERGPTSWHDQGSLRAAAAADEARAQAEWTNYMEYVEQGRVCAGDIPPHPAVVALLMASLGAGILLVGRLGERFRDPKSAAARSA